jgi:hypothetical protein
VQPLRAVGDIVRAMRVPTAPLAGAGLIAGFGVAVASGSRPLGGAALAGFGLACMALWQRRSGTRTMWTLTGIGLGAFAASHGLGPLIGAWPSVLVCAAATALACDRLSDAQWRTAARA